MVSFVETMRGSVRDTSNTEHPIEFTVKAEAMSAHEVARGIYTVRGIVRAPPWSDETLATGTMKISVSTQQIHYHVEFKAHDGEHLSIDGVKNVNPLALLKTMTELPVTVKKTNGEQVAAGTMMFELKDLPPFLASWLPFGKRAQRALDTERVALEHRLAT